MKIFSTAQIREIDSYTIEHEPISTIHLIERVADALFKTFKQDFSIDKKIAIIAGKGNNGSDALALAYRLQNNGYTIVVYGHDSSICKPETIYFRQKCEVLPIETFLETQISQFDIIIDGLLGTGLSKLVEGIEMDIIKHINASKSKIISIDIPSGMNGDSICDEETTIVKANVTYTLEFPKLGYMFPENGCLIGNIEIVPIGLHKEAITNQLSTFYFTQKENITIKPRNRFSHKGTFGHVVVVGGSLGKMGANVLSSKAALKIGAGLVTSHCPSCGVTILQVTNPEGMVSIDKEADFISEIPNIDKVNSICLGPGIGTNIKTQRAIIQFLKTNTIPLIIDADGLNCLAIQNASELIPENTIITPHIKEFERLFGEFENSHKRILAQIEISKKQNIYIILKGYRTSISTPQGELFFNSTGNPGMATAGSGDVLSGIIAGLLAQDYSPKEAAIYGVFIHGLAGDFASEHLTEYCVTSKNILQFIPRALKTLI